MKLEFKHAALYLPHSVGVLLEISPEECESFPLTLDNIEGVVEYQRKLILHPMSDFEKEIEHNGERFIPSGRINQEFHKINGYNARIKYVKSDSFPKDQMEFAGSCHGILSIDYWIVDQLIEWRFDVLGLIPAGTAYNINDL